MRLILLLILAKSVYLTDKIIMMQMRKVDGTAAIV
jgi:hypothetical protein